MTKLASTGWASVLLGLALIGTAAAQTAPTEPDTTTTTPDVDADVDADTTTPTTTDDTTVTTPTSPPPTPPADIDINVQTAPPPPPPVATDTTTYVPPPMADDYDDADEGILKNLGFGIAAGGGAGGFVNDSLRNTTSVGGDWDVRATIGTRMPIAFEGSYIGSAQSIDALGLDNDAVLVGNGVQGALRFSAPIGLPFRPFAFGGAAWRRYDLTGSDTNLSDVAGADDVLELPVGIGIGGSWNGLMLDARGEYRFSADNDLLPVTEDGSDYAEMDRWGIKGTVGVEF